MQREQKAELVIDKFEGREEIPKQKRILKNMPLKQESNVFLETVRNKTILMGEGFFTILIEINKSLGAKVADARNIAFITIGIITTLFLMFFIKHPIKSLILIGLISLLLVLTNI